MTHNRKGVFMVTSVVALITLIIPWYFLSHYLVAPVISVSGQLMDSTFLWVDGFERYETVGTLLTPLNVAVTQNGRLVVGQLSPR